MFRCTIRDMLTFCLALSSTAVFAQDEDREIALPFVTLVQPPKIPKLEVTPLAIERADEINQLIQELSRIAKRDLSLNETYHGSTFVPVGEFNPFGDWTGKQVEVSDPIRKLVESGPDS